MQNAASLLSAYYAPETDYKSLSAGRGSAEKNSNSGFSAVISREISKADEAFQIKKTTTVKRENKSSKNDMSDEMAAMAASGNQNREQRNDFKVSKDESASAVENTDKAAAVDEAAANMDTDVQAGTDDDALTLQTTLRELFELLKSPQAKELFDMLSGQDAQDMDAGELIARLETLIQADDASAVASFAKELLTKLEGSQTALLDTADSDMGKISGLDETITLIDGEAETEETGAMSVMEFGAKLRRALSEIDRTDPAQMTESGEEDAAPDIDRAVMRAHDDDSTESGDEDGQKNAGDSKHQIIDIKKPAEANTLSPNPAFIQDAIKAANLQVQQAAASIQTTPFVDVNSIIGQIVEKMSLETSQDMSQMELQLSPEFLGKLSIVLTSTSEGVSASIRAASDSVRVALAANIAELENSLKSNGINMKDISVTNEGLSWDFARGGRQDAHGGNFERRSFGENLRQPTVGRTGRDNKISILDINNNYNADALSHLANPASLTGSVEFLA